MYKQVIVKHNQSLADISISQYGSMNAAMQLAMANNVPISQAPETGSTIIAPDIDSSFTDDTVVNYLRKNEIVIGTLNATPLTCIVVLKPELELTPAVSGNPHTIGFYSFHLSASGEFIHSNALVSPYLSDNTLYYQTEERYITAEPVELSGPIDVAPLPEVTILYKLPWTEGFGYMLIWSSLETGAPSIAVQDTSGNEGYYAPLYLLDNTSQALVATLIGDLQIEVVSASSASVTIRVTRSHAPISLLNFAEHTMEWLFDATGGMPDPEDPENTDKIILTLEPGNYSLGLRTTYYYPMTTPHLAYPSSQRSMVISIQNDN